MDIVTFRCKACNVTLTNALRRLRGAARLSEQDATEHVPVGFYWLVPSSEADDGYYASLAGQYLINLQDAVNTKQHTNTRRLNGCCGLDGCDGLNTLCLNGHEIGTERSDCWMAHSLALDPAAVTVS